MERLQKIISAAGVASRRKAEELITSGLVQVNGQTVTELGTKADAGKDHIRVDGKLLKFSDHHVYILLNKPKGYVTTLSDPEGRPTILDLLRGVKARVYPVGRLDYASEGLLLLTNDGEMANALTKAASHVPKTYLVKVSGQPSDAAIEQLRSGIELPDRKGIHSRTAPAGIQLVHKAENPWYEVTLIEGRNRQVRAMFEQTGHHVEKLKRVRYGPFTLDVHPGKFRNLLPEEVEQLRSAIKRGSSASAEAAVRPADRPTERKESHIETALREEARSPVKFQAESEVQDKPKRTPKPLGTVASRPRTSSSRPEKTRPGGLRGSNFRDNDFRKKSPSTSRFRRDGAPFQKRANETSPRPVPPRSTGERPVWSKPGSSRSSAPGTGQNWDSKASSPTSRPRTFDKSSPRPARPASTGERPVWKKPDTPRNSSPSVGRPGVGRPGAGAPRKWTQGAPARTARTMQTGRPPARGQQRPDQFRPNASRLREDAAGGAGGDLRSDVRESRPPSPNLRPRPYDRSASPSDRPARSSQRPEGKRPSSFRNNAPSSLGPRKWTNNAPSPKARAAASDRPKPGGFERDAARPRTARPLTARPRADRPSKPRFKAERGGAARPERPGAPPARSGTSAQPPFWKGADKRRPRKEAAEGDFETRPAEREQRSAPGKPGGSKFAPPKAASKFKTSKFKTSRPDKKRR